jgi:uncharacterized glyoxalase superfamily protein PhnB
MVRATTITPVLRYRDVSLASRWLCAAFGFQEHNRAQELGGHVRYVSLRLGDSFVLLRPIGSSVFDNLMVQPETVGGANTQTCYLTIADATDHSERAKAAGAIIELEPQDDGLGGSFYTCRDLEGHLWSFGAILRGCAWAYQRLRTDRVGPISSASGNCCTPQIQCPQAGKARASSRNRDRSSNSHSSLWWMVVLFQWTAAGAPTGKRPRGGRDCGCKVSDCRSGGQTRQGRRGGGAACEASARRVDGQGRIAEGSNGTSGCEAAEGGIAQPA